MVGAGAADVKRGWQEVKQAVVKEFACHTPLWPAGHLPLKGGDQLAAKVSSTRNDDNGAWWSTQLISPLEGEMAGRPEGGVSA